MTRYTALLLALLASCGSGAVRADAGCCDQCYRAVGDMPGPEDFELDTTTSAGRRLLVSASERRENTTAASPPDGLYAMALPGRDLEPPVLLASEAAGCPLHPHGISLARPSAGGALLFVVNHSRAAEHGSPSCRLPVDHDGRPFLHQIAVFRVRADRLDFERWLTSPELFHPNDVTALGPDDVFATNTPDLLRRMLELLHVWETSNVVHFDGTSWRTVADDMRFANGVLATRDRVYVAAMLDEEVHEFAREHGGLRRLRAIEVGSGVDNLAWGVAADGRPVTDTVFVAAHPSLLAFFRHARDSGRRARADVFRLALGDERVATRIFRGDGTAVSAASVGLVVGSRLYMGQVFDRGIVQCDCDGCDP